MLEWQDFQLHTGELRWDHYNRGHLDKVDELDDRN